MQFTTVVLKFDTVFADSDYFINTTVSRAKGAGYAYRLITETYAYIIFLNGTS